MKLFSFHDLLNAWAGNAMLFRNRCERLAFCVRVKDCAVAGGVAPVNHVYGSFVFRLVDHF